MLHRLLGFTMFKKKKAKGQETEPSRILALKECCDLLLAAGYFRARLVEVSAFDRVVGGLPLPISLPLFYLRL